MSFTKEDVRRLYCVAQNYASALDDEEFIDSWRFVKYRDEYMASAFEIAKLLKEIHNGYKETNP